MKNVYLKILIGGLIFAGSSRAFADYHEVKRCFADVNNYAVLDVNDRDPSDAQIVVRGETAPSIVAQLNGFGAAEDEFIYHFTVPTQIGDRLLAGKMHGELRSSRPFSEFSVVYTLNSEVLKVEEYFAGNRLGSYFFQCK